MAVRTLLLRGALAAIVVMVLLGTGSAPTRTIAAPPNDDVADWAIGAPEGYDGGSCNNGGAVSRNFLCHPTDSAWDTARNLYVADTGNNRVLQYNQPLTTDVLPDFVFGQPNFTTSTCVTPSSITLCGPTGVHVDSGQLFVADSVNNRILAYALSPADTIADRVYGQAGFGMDFCNQGGLSAASLCTPSFLTTDANHNLYVADEGNHRVLGYSGIVDMTADRVFGQPNMTSGSIGTSTLAQGNSVAVDPAGNLFVGEYYGAGVSLFLNAMASDSIVDAHMGDNSCIPCATSMAKINDVTFGPGGILYVVDYFQERVTAHYSPATTDFAADFVFGTADSLTTTLGFCNGGSELPSKQKFCGPVGVSVSADNTVAIAEHFSSRVLLFFAPELTDRIPDRVVGQPTVWTNSLCNAGGISANNLCVPWDAAVDADGNVYIADLNNNRVLGYISPLTTDFVADMVFGQNGSFTSNAFLAPTATTLSSPTSVAVDAAGNLYVSDALNNRILVFVDPFSTDTTADHVFGQANYTTGTANSGGISASSLWSPQGLRVDPAGNVYVVDLGNHRALQYNTPLTTDKVADRVFGQANFTSLGCNNGGVSASTLCFPYGIGVDGTGSVYIADENNARVLRYDAPLTTDTVADAAFGQPNFISTDCNNNLPVDADAICRPNGIAFDGGNLYIGDRANHRVLRVAGFGTPVQVLGQLGSFTTTAFNNGGESARTLQAPRFMTTDGQGRLYVADASNHRVLIYDTVVGGDTDADLIANTVDNCPTVHNPAQAHSDRNFIDNSPPYAPGVDDKTWPNSDPTGDACDTGADADNDGRTNANEASGTGCAGAATSPTLRDTDGDRFLDGAECVLGTNPANAASKPLLTACGAAGDADADKITTRIEVCFYNSDPTVIDTDGDAALDGGKDGCEIASLNGDRIVSSIDQGMLAQGISGSAGYTVNVDINKDGVLSSIDQGLMASFIVPPGQCP